MAKKPATAEPLRVKILDECYLIKRKGEDDSYYTKIAGYVDEKMRKIVNSSAPCSIDRVTILAALRICEELFKIKKEKEDSESFLKKKLQEITETIESAIT